MEVLAVSRSIPREFELKGMRIKTSIIHEPLTSTQDYIELDETGIIGNKTAAHDGPVYAFFAENYDYWRSDLGVDPSAWDWCHWGENITLRYKEQPHLETDIHLGDVWRIGQSVRLEVCGSRIPCAKLAWRCGQKDQWLKPLADTGRVGVYLRVLEGGRIHPGDQAYLETPSNDSMDVATITQVAYDTSLRTGDTMNILANHHLLLPMNKFFIKMKQISVEDQLIDGKYAWKGWRNLEVTQIVDEGVDLKSFYLKSTDDQPLANYLPGQFLSIQLPSEKIRSWTISDYPTRDGPAYYRISIKKANEASSWMHERCRVGTVLPGRSPAGRLFLDWKQKIAFRQVYISAGIGITPILAMMKAHGIHPKFKGTPALWIHVARNSRSFSFKDELSELQIPLERHLFFSNPLESDEEGVHYDHAGRPDKAFLKEVLGASYRWNPLGTQEMTLDAKMSTFNICGPTSFETSVKECLKELKIPPPVIKSEAFSSSGTVTGDIKTAKVRFTKSDMSTTWVQEKPQSLLELAESLGLTPDYGCRVGACGSCVAKITCGSVNGGVQMDGTVLVCSAVPASDVVELDM
ncbi:putative Pyruvate kinase-like protein [Seiridium unicorne]|uniref:Pyruvate kinase-like protein n=1 Tax=Seiridium unicorne TaxID=138068 RepID=A0ABR2V910_9PEZI